MQVCVVVVVLSTLVMVVMGDCDLKTQWGGDACTLGQGLHVTSHPGNITVIAELGKCNLFYPKVEFQKQPTVGFQNVKAGDLYTLVMVDPDAPNHPEGQYYLHWIVANIPGEDLKMGDLKRAKIITGWRGPSPPDGSGTHRYMFLVYRHDSPNLKVVREVPDSQRRLFDLGAWAAGHHLCGPLAGVQFRTNFSGKPEARGKSTA